MYMPAYFMPLVWIIGLRQRLAGAESYILSERGKPRRLFWTTCADYQLPLNLLRDSCAGRPKNIEHGRLNAAMQRSAITRNNVGRIAQETGRAYRRWRPRCARRQEILWSWRTNIKRRSNLTLATAVIAHILYGI